MVKKVKKFGVKKIFGVKIFFGVKSGQKTFFIEKRSKKFGVKKKFRGQKIRGQQKNSGSKMSGVNYACADITNPPQISRAIALNKAIRTIRLSYDMLAVLPSTFLVLEKLGVTKIRTNIK